MPHVKTGFYLCMVICSTLKNSLLGNLFKTGIVILAYSNLGIYHWFNQQMFSCACFLIFKLLVYVLENLNSFLHYRLIEYPVRNKRKAYMGSIKMFGIYLYLSPELIPGSLFVLAHCFMLLTVTQLVARNFPISFLFSFLFRWGKWTRLLRSSKGNRR